MFDFLDNLCSLFSDGDGWQHDTGDNTGFNFDCDGTGIDLSNYSMDDIEEAIRSAIDSNNHDGISIDDITDHSTADHGYDVSFCGSPDVDARNLAKSSLLAKMSSYHIHTTTPVTTDSTWGGLDYYSGNQVAHAINAARDNGMISDSVYKDLLALLKKACHTQ